MNNNLTPGKLYRLEQSNSKLKRLEISAYELFDGELYFSSLPNNSILMFLEKNNYNSLKIKDFVVRLFLFYQNKRFFGIPESNIVKIDSQIIKIK